jgi:hypothetical protein
MSFEVELVKQHLLHHVRSPTIDSISLSNETESALQTASNSHYFNDIGAGLSFENRKN